MTISTNIHNHIQARFINQEIFKNNLRTLYSIDFALNYFVLTSKKAIKGAQGIFYYLFSPYIVINATVYQEYSVDDTVSLQLTKALSIAQGLFNNTHINYKRLTRYYITKNSFIKLINALTATFLCLPPYYIGVQ